MAINSEFSLIEHFFSQQAVNRADVVLGIGDDCALLTVPSGKVLAVSMDVLVSGRHFLPDTDPVSLGHKALAVNLSDLAAQGAQPAWITLGLTLPNINQAWLEGFCQGFFALAEHYGLQLVGGDTTRGPLNIAVQVHGFVDPNKAIRRDDAKPGDVIFVTGTPGDAGLALAAKLGLSQVMLRGDVADYLQMRLQRPDPRIPQGLALARAGLATSAIDVSDGLAQDLGHILQRSGVGATLYVEQLPRSSALATSLDQDAAITAVLNGGDDYELCFTVPPAQHASLDELIKDWDCACTAIGVIESQPGLRCQWADGSPYQQELRGHDHFR